MNLTDGLDGLAAGSATFAFAAFVIIGFWEFRHPRVYGVGRRARPRARRGGDGRRVRRLPLVERGAGAGLHGRHRVRSRIGGAMAALALLTNTHCCCPSSAACS